MPNTWTVEQLAKRGPVVQTGRPFSASKRYADILLTTGRKGHWPAYDTTVPFKEEKDGIIFLEKKYLKIQNSHLYTIFLSI